jgi:phosphatidyl-myo-inositol dimannoside synthase
VPDAFGGHGGIALFNRDLLTALCSHRDCLQVMAIPRLMPHKSEPLPERLSYISGAVNSKIKYVAAVMASIARNPKINLIVCGHINLLPLAYLVKLITRAPILLEIYGIDAWEPSNSYFNLRLLHKIDCIVSISEHTTKKFLSWSKVESTKLHLLPNAIDMSKYGVRAKNPSLLSRYGLHDKKIIMTFGRLVSKERQKGFDEMIEVLPELVKEVPNISYLIAGDGPDKERLRSKAHALGIGERVIFTGFVPEAEKADYYRLADAYVMPSRGEGFGFVFLEAMACGIPVVASLLDGSREAVREGELGLLADPTDKESIKSAILKALNQTPGVIPKGLEYFSLENFRERLHHIIDATISN